MKIFVSFKSLPFKTETKYLSFYLSIIRLSLQQEIDIIQHATSMVKISAVYLYEMIAFKTNFLFQNNWRLFSYFEDQI